MKRHPFAVASPARVTLVVVFALFAAGPVAAQIVGYKADPQGKDELWDITSKMEMVGMPFAMPERTSRVCVEKGNDAGTVPKNEGCTIVEQNRAGNRFTYKMACKDAKNDYTATGESTTTGNGYQGKMHMVGKMDGTQMDMSMSYSGARAGNCTSTIKQEVAAMKSQSDKQVADMCRDGMDKLQAMYFFGEPRPICPGKNEFCAAVGRAAQSMQDPGQYSATIAKNGDVKTSFAKCNVDFAATTKAACGRAAGSRNWRFVGGGNCDDDVRAQGKAHCEGRGSSPDPEYYPLCSRYVTITRGNAAANAPAAPAAQPARAPSTTDSVQQGLDAVKKLLPF